MEKLSFAAPVGASLVDRDGAALADLQSSPAGQIRCAADIQGIAGGHHQPFLERGKPDHQPLEVAQDTAGSIFSRKSFLPVKGNPTRCLL